MSLYYEDSAVRLFMGDAREILPSIAGPVAIVTDPPFGTGWARGAAGDGVGDFTARHIQPEWDRFSTDWIGLAPDVRFLAVFTAPSKLLPLLMAIPKPSAVVNWRKTNPRPLGYALEPIVLAPALLPDGLEFPAYNGDTPLHPCQKPEDLMQWLLGFVDPSLTVVDPFCGSGTTLVAAKKLGRRAIGIEADPTYIERARRRLSQEVLPLEAG